MTPISRGNTARIPVVTSHHPEVDPIGWGEFNENGQLVITVERMTLNANLYTMARNGQLKELHLGFFSMAIPVRDTPTQSNVFDDVGTDVREAPKIDPSEEEN